jgi:hypothetical protein
MMNKAKGPVWHKKQKEKGLIPKGLRGIDKDATWGKSNADGWVYGHGSFPLTSHKVPVLGCFIWMRNSANEAKRMWLETGLLKDRVDYVAMDSKADDYGLFREMNRQRQITLITCCRKNMVVSENRLRMHKVMQQPKHKQIYKERAYRVEPMQGLVKDIFELDRCWMRGNKSNRWLFAAMGLTIQMHQLNAYRQNRSTWKIKDEVLG